jgi:Lon protease-like protein
MFRGFSTILMPRAYLPVVVNREAFYDMSSEVVVSNIIAVVQPEPIFPQHVSVAQSFKAGCAGKVVDVNFIGDDVAIIFLGLCRFEIIQDLGRDITGIERILVSYDRFAVDMEEQIDFDCEEKKRLMAALDGYFKAMNITPNWQELEKASLGTLVSTIAMLCPFHPSEKQTLMEEVDIKAMSDLMIKIIEMNTLDRYSSVFTVN